VERLKATGDVSKLAKADQYFDQVRYNVLVDVIGRNHFHFCKIMDIPRLAERLECMQLRRRLDLDIEEIRPDLNILRNASRELRSSLRFKQTLQIILVLGNRLNGSTFRGGAKGFQLESLLKVIHYTRYF